MKRRTLLLGGIGAAAVGGALVWRPTDKGAPHNAYFAEFNRMLKREGPGKPVMLIDKARLDHNIDLIAGSVGENKTYRVVVKSLPSIELVSYIMARANTRSLMLFHQPFINLVASRIADADVLIGKPMPVQAARTFYRKLDAAGDFNPERQLQWLIDSSDRLLQYQALARELKVKMRVNFELDVGLHRGGFESTQHFRDSLEVIKDDQEHLSFAGFMGYEPHLTGTQAALEDDSVQGVLAIYKSFLSVASAAGIDVSSLTLNGAGSHTLGIYEKDDTMNDLSAGSGVVMPTDFDTWHLRDNKPALFIATPILKQYDSMKLPVMQAIADLWSTWDPNRQKLYYIYGGYWKAKFVSPPGVPDPIFNSTNQEPVSTSNSVDLDVDDYMFLRPTQSEHVMLQFGDLLVVEDGRITDQWPIFQETG